MDDATKIKSVLDSGATDHMVNEKQHFNSLQRINEMNISVAKKNEKITAKKRGEISIKTFYNGDTSLKKMQNVLYVRDLKCNLMSIRSLTRKGFKVLFEGDYAYVSLNGQLMFVGHADGQLYEVEFHVERDLFAGITGEDNLQTISQHLWHYRLAHLNVFHLKKRALI